MEFTEITVLVRLILGALATFFAILLWSKTRDVAWVLVIVGTLIAYAEIVFTTLEEFGILKERSVSLFGLSAIPFTLLLQTVLSNLPLVLYTLAFIILVLRRRLR